MSVKDKNKLGLAKIFLGALSFMAAIFIYGAVSANKPLSTLTKSGAATVVIKDKTILAEVADTPKERTRGLSGRKPLEENEGMIFIFENPDIYGFWMKDMLFPLDIIWINESKMVVSVTKNAAPESYPLVFYPDVAVKYVLEIPAGFSEKNNLKKGDRVVIK